MRNKRIDRATLVNFFRSRTTIRRKHLPFPIDLMTLFNPSRSLGDSVLLTGVSRTGFNQRRPISLTSFSRHLPTLKKFNPFHVALGSPFLVNVDLLNTQFDTGNGHIIQRLERACGLVPDLLPRGSIAIPDAPPKVPCRVALHLDPSSDAHTSSCHPRPRILTPQSLSILQNFVSLHPQLEICQVGMKSHNLRGVIDKTEQTLEDMFRFMASCEYFIGVDSGPMHIAAALDLKMIIIVNYPIPSEICLPVIKPIYPVLYRPSDNTENQDWIANTATGEVLDWLYPQSTLLHQDAEGGPHVKQLSVDNLSRAFEGELYPYWSPDYLDLVFEDL